MHHDPGQEMKSPIEEEHDKAEMQDKLKRFKTGLSKFKDHRLRRDLGKGYEYATGAAKGRLAAGTEVRSAWSGVLISLRVYASVQVVAAVHLMLNTSHT